MATASTDLRRAMIGTAVVAAAGTETGEEQADTLEMLHLFTGTDLTMTASVVLAMNLSNGDSEMLAANVTAHGHMTAQGVRAPHGNQN
jgi:hypothetical protein